MVSDFYPPFLGGVEVLVSNLSRELVLRGHDVAVATLAAPGLPLEDIDEGVRVHRIRPTTQRAPWIFANRARPWAPPVPDPEATVALGRLIKSHEPDVVHGHDWLARSFLPLKRHGGPRFVMSLHYYTLSCPKKNLLYGSATCTGPALSKCLGCAGRHYGTTKGAVVTLGQLGFGRVEASLVDHFLPVSAATAAGNGLWSRGLSYSVVPNFVRAAQDAGSHAHLLAVLPKEPFLLFVGDVRRDKGIDVLLDAYARLDDRPPLIIIGARWPNSPERLPPGADLLGEWPNTAVREAMRRSLALIVPSLWPEPFGIVAAEALSAGRPVVASAVGGIPEIVREGREGLLVAPGDAAALAVAMATIVRDAPMREACATRASLRARAYTAPAIVPLFEAIYRRVVRRQRG
jgi:glycosyltransferase involved in cell wall biosynthesis